MNFSTSLKKMTSFMLPMLHAEKPSLVGLAKGKFQTVVQQRGTNAICPFNFRLSMVPLLTALSFFFNFLLFHNFYLANLDYNSIKLTQRRIVRFTDCIN